MNKYLVSCCTFWIKDSKKRRDIKQRLKNGTFFKKQKTHVFYNGMSFAVLPHNFWYIFETWESNTKNFYKKNVHPDYEILDIGAWIGPTTFIGYALNPKHIHVIEANPATYQTLKMNVFNNYMQDKVSLYNKCVYEKSNEIISFGFTKHSTTDTSTCAINGDGVNVKTISFVDLLNIFDLNLINIIKIDIEGGEEFIAEGLMLIREFSHIKVNLSIHIPFWKHKEETATTLLSVFSYFTALVFG